MKTYYRTKHYGMFGRAINDGDYRLHLGNKAFIGTYHASTDSITWELTAVPAGCIPGILSLCKQMRRDWLQTHLDFFIPKNKQ